MSFSVRDLLILKNAEGIGNVKARIIVNNFQSLENLINASPTSFGQLSNFNEKIYYSIKKAFADSKFQKAADRQLDLAEKHDAKIISYLDDEYPENLHDVYDKPVILFYKGTLKPSDTTSLAMVGSRNVTEYGTMTALKMSEELSHKGFTIISGMATGIDTYAHQGALNAKGRTIAILGTGIDKIYPRSNVELFHKIVENGAVISDFTFGTPSLPENFPTRNRIISGITLGTIVIEAASNSGSLITARSALEQNREVFAVPGNVSSTRSNGTNQLIRDSAAKLVLSADDIIQEFKDRLVVDTEGTSVDSKRQSKSSKKNLPKAVELTEVEQNIYDALDPEGTYIDKISIETKIEIPALLTQLLLMEMNGIIKKLQGNRYVGNI